MCDETFKDGDTMNYNNFVNYALAMYVITMFLRAPRKIGSANWDTLVK